MFFCGEDLFYLLCAHHELHERSQLVAVLGPEVDQIEVRGAKIVFLRNLSFRLLLGTVLIPVGRDETQQGVIAVARAADVTAQETYLFGSGSIAKR